MKITEAEEYRRAIRESQELDQARPGTPEYERRQELRAAMHEYELHLQEPECRKGRPQRMV
ncbi:MAG TPA: hypothetical protein VJ770_02335 [Stellaceae bacterium]|nr:hypothetical protein [Stellaceae bacterium]